MSLPEQRLGPYRRVRLLGSGGMGTVFLVEHEQLGVRRALKLLSVSDPELRLRFLREGQALAAVDDHPHVARVHELGEADGQPYLVLDLLEGGDLSARLRQGPLDPREAAALVRDLARGLAHVHARGVLHRDLKPQNVLFDAQGRARLADFGLAAIRGAAPLTQTGTLMGTPAYMAPELVLGDGSRADERSDVYGLGAVLYECLTGQAPFTGGPLPELLQRVAREEPPPPTKLRPEVPAALEAVCLAAMAKAPAARTPSAAALAEALERFLTTGRGPRRVGARALAMGGAVALALALAALGLPPLDPPRPGPDEGSRKAPAPPAPAPASMAAHRGAQEAEEDYLRLEQRGSPAERLELARRWLEAHRGHPRAEQVEAIERAAREQLPLAALPGPRALGPGRWVRGRFLSADRVVLWGEGADQASIWEAPPEGEPRAAGRLQLPDEWTEDLLPWAGGLLAATPRRRLTWLALDGSAREELALEPLGGSPCCLAAIPQGLAVSSGAGTWRLRLEGLGLRAVQRLEYPADFVPRCLLPLADGALACAGDMGDRGEVRLYPPESRSATRRFFLLTGAYALALAPDGRLWVGTRDGRILGFDPTLDHEQRPAELGRESASDPWRELELLNMGHPVGLSAWPDGRHLSSLSAGNDPEENALRTWDLRTGQPLRTRRLPLRCRSLAASPDGRRLLVGLDDGAQLWPR